MYGLYAAREFTKDEILGCYMGKYVKQKENVKEEYQCGNIKPDRDEPYMCMHMINDSLYEYYIEDDKEESNEIKVLEKGKNDDLETARKKLCNRANVMIITDYQVVAIIIGTELKLHYNW